MPEQHKETFGSEQTSNKPVVERFPIVNSEGKPSANLIELLQVLKLPHDGTLNSIVSITQEKFFQTRSDGQRKERWELDEVMPEFRGQVMPVLDRLGMLAEIAPSSDRYDYALMPGALVTRVRTRLKYLSDLWEKAVRSHKLVFLGSERPLAESRRETEILLDPNNQELPFRAEWQPPQELPTTELGMMQLVWDQANLPKDLRQVNTEWINAPMKSDPSGGRPLRPSTEDTIQEWLKTKPYAGTCIALSNNPHIAYQHSVLKTHLPKDFSLETVGPSASLNLPLAFYLGEMARWLYQERQRLNNV